MKKVSKKSTKTEDLFPRQQTFLNCVIGLCVIILLLYVVGYGALYFRTWSHVVGGSFLSFMGAFFLIELSPIITIFLLMKSGWSFGDAIIPELPALYPCAIILIMGLWKLLADYLDKNKSKILTLCRWIFFLPIIHLLEDCVFLPTYNVVAKSLFFSYPETILPVIFSPFVWRPIISILSFETAYLLIPKFKKPVLLILAFLVSVHGAFEIIELAFKMGFRGITHIHNIITFLSVVLTPFLAYLIVVHVIHYEGKLPFKKKD